MTDERDDTKHYDGPAGGWGSLRGIGSVFARELSTPAVAETLMRQNKAEGYMCSSCAWGKPAHPHPFEFCENGAKATLWDLTSDRCTPEFFAEHTVTELLDWADYDLEMQGRLTEPMRYDAGQRQLCGVQLGRGLRRDRRRAQCARSEVGGVLRLGQGRRWKPPTSTRCSPASTATTTCPTAPTCATRPPRSA